MSKRKFVFFLDDILESINKIEEYTCDLAYEEFEINFEKQDAVYRRLEIIGEAVKHVPAEIRHQFPDVPWQEVAGLRDVIIHNYFGLVPKRVWNVLHTDLPKFKQQMQEVRRSINE